MPTSYKRKSRKSFCQKDAKYTTAKVAGEFIGILSRLLKTFLFNLFAFVAGFASCFMMMNVLHQHDEMHQKMQLEIEQIEKIVDSIDVECKSEEQQAAKLKKALESLKQNTRATACWKR